MARAHRSDALGNVFFASQVSSYITAEMLAVTGGQPVTRTPGLPGGEGPTVTMLRGVRPCGVTNR
jgi:hypothetical protein